MAKHFLSNRGRPVALVWPALASAPFAAYSAEAPPGSSRIPPPAAGSPPVLEELVVIAPCEKHSHAIGQRAGARWKQPGTTGGHRQEWLRGGNPSSFLLLPFVLGLKVSDLVRGGIREFSDCGERFGRAWSPIEQMDSAVSGRGNQRALHSWGHARQRIGRAEWQLGAGTARGDGVASALVRARVHHVRGVPPRLAHPGRPWFLATRRRADSRNPRSEGWHDGPD